MNYLAILLAAVTAMVVGALWYSPLMFAKKWMSLIGKSENELKKMNMSKAYGLTLAGALITAYVLAMFINLTGGSTLADGVRIGVWAWLGFVATSFITTGMFEGRKNDLVMINIGYFLVNLVLMGAIIGAWH